MGAGIEYCISPVNDQNNPAYCFQGIDNGWRQIDFSELYDPPPASDLLTRYQSCFPGHSISADFASMMFVKPQFAFPPDVTDIDPVWATWGGSTCTPVNLGVYDPPRVLQKATALAPVATRAADPQAEKAPPSPAATLKSPVAAPTKAVTDPNTGATAGHPGSNKVGMGSSTTGLSDPVAVVNPVDPSVVAQNKGSPETGNNKAVKAGSNSNSNSDPMNGGSSSDPNSNLDLVNAGSSPNLKWDPSSSDPKSNPVSPGTDTTPVDAKEQSGANVATNSGKDSGTDFGTGNNDPSTAPITLLPQQNADTATENSGSNGKTAVTIGGTSGGTNEGTTGGSNGATSKDSNEGTSGGSYGGTNDGSNAPNSDDKDEGMSGGTGGGTTLTNGATSGGTDKGFNGGTHDGNANPVPMASINSQPITKDTSGNILLSGSTLAPGSTAIFSGHTIANAPSAVVIDGSTYAPSPSTPSVSPLLVDNQLLQITNGKLEIGSQTLTPGTHTTMNNHVIDHANPSQIIEDGVIHNLAPVSSSNPLVLGGQTLLRASNGGLITAGTTITPSSTASIGGHVYSLAGSSSVIMDSNTYGLPAATNAYQIQPATPSPQPTLPSNPLTLANGLVITLQPSTPSSASPHYLLPNGASLSPGGAPATYAGTTYSALPSNAGILASGPSGSTTTLALPSPSHLPHLATQSVFTAADMPFTAAPTGFQIGATSLVPGGHAFTIDGTVVSLDTNFELVVGSSTYRLSLAPPQSVFSIDGAAFTASPTGFVVMGKEVLPGESGVVENGVTVSLGTGGVLRVGVATVTLGAAASTATGVGRGSAGVQVFEGGAGRVVGRVFEVGIVVVMVGVLTGLS